MLSMFENNFIIQLCVNVINWNDCLYTFKSNFHCPGIFLLYYIMVVHLSSYLSPHIMSEVLFHEYWMFEDNFNSSNTI